MIQVKKVGAWEKPGFDRVIKKGKNKFLLCIPKNGNR